ncbi:MAG TPA: hypothetical protein IAC03_06770 [Candidatus Coprenecus pullistercoris]|nr:hypothetical protein [Candidatus Coprenecus pullistercoris]
MKETKSSFERKGDTLYLITSSEAVDYLNSSIDAGFISSLHRISAKGIFQSLVECCMTNGLGFDITGDSDLTDDEFLYGNTRYVAIVSVNDEQEGDFVNFMFNHGMETTLLGHVTKGELRMDDHSYGFISDYAGKTA